MGHAVIMMLRPRDESRRSSSCSLRGRLLEHLLLILQHFFNDTTLLTHHHHHHHHYYYHHLFLFIRTTTDSNERLLTVGATNRPGDLDDAVKTLIPTHS